MMRNVMRGGTVIVLACLMLACATRFSPGKIRTEITRQSGQDPLSVFELNLGRFTTMLMKNVLAAEDGTLPFEGLEQLQLAVFEAPSETGPAIDVTLIPVRGWEPVVRMRDEVRSAMVLIRPAGDTVGDIVVVGSGKKKVVYGRLRGNFSPELPSALAEVLRDGGPDQVQKMLTEVGGESP